MPTVLMGSTQEQWQVAPVFEAGEECQHTPLKSTHTLDAIDGNLDQKRDESSWSCVSPLAKGTIALSDEWMSDSLLTYRLKQFILVYMKKERDKQLSIRFPLTLCAWIDAQATENRRSFNAQVIWMLQDYLKAKEKDKREP